MCIFNWKRKKKTFPANMSSFVKDEVGQPQCVKKEELSKGSLTTDDPLINLNKNKSAEKNVLFLCMSTLPWNFRNDLYVYTEGNKEYSFHCHSQLEAGTKTLLSKLYDAGATLDKVIVLHTKECALPSTSKDIEKYQIVIGSDKSISANDFYKQRIMQCVDGELSDDFFEFVPLYDEITEKESIFDAVPKVCDNIIGSSNPAEVTVHIDTQGGRRNETFVMNCVLNMLKLRDVKIGEYFAIDFEPSRHEHPIRNVTLNNIMLDLVSAMKLFIETGRADELSKYYKKYKAIKRVNTIPENNIIEQIKKLSMALSICNVADFRFDLKNLEEKFDEYEQVDRERKDPIFMHLFNDFKNEYQCLLEANHTIADEIEWLLEHQFYQQALTMTEAYLPEYALKPLLFNEDKCIEIINEFYENRSNSKYKKCFKGDMNDLQNPYYYIFKILRLTCKAREDIPQVLQLSEFTDRKVSVNINRNFVQAKINGGPNSKNKTAQIKDLLDKYYDVKQLRNKTNHGGASKTEKVVENKINSVLELAKKLNLECESDEFI